MNASELVKECEKKVGWRLTPALYGYWSINIPMVKFEDWKLIHVLYSFTDDFETIRNGIPFNELDKIETNNFIEICNNRIEHAKTFLSDVATVLGFIITSLALVVAVASIKINEGDILPDPGLKAVISHGIVLTILVALLLSGIVILSALLIRYRTCIHAWTAFKEGAILNKPS